MAKFQVGNLLETARPVWAIDDEGNILGLVAKPLHVTGTVAIASGEEGDTFVRDDTTGALTTILVPHHEIHEGETFFCSWKTADASPLADNANVTFGVTTGAKEVHIIARGSCGGDMEGAFYEAPTFTGGAAVSIFNKKRNSSRTTTVTVVVGPTVTNVGTLLENEFVPGGTGPQAVGGAGQQRAEWILAPGTKYLFRIINRAGNNQPASLALEWYEEAV